MYSIIKVAAMETMAMPIKYILKLSATIAAELIEAIATIAIAIPGPWIFFGRFIFVI